MEAPKIIEVKIGRFEEKYVSAITMAPKDYDYGGTIELKVLGKNKEDKHERRIILVPIGSINFQMGRNASGMHRTDFDEMDRHMLKYVENLMVEKFKGGK